MTDVTIPTPKQWRALIDLPQSERGWLADDEAEAVSLLAPRRLRGYQAAGLIKAEPASTGAPGIGRRMWRRDEVFVATAAGDVARLMDWSMQKAAGAMLCVLRAPAAGKGGPPYSKSMHLLVEDSLMHVQFRDQNEPIIVGRSIADWHLLIFDAKFLFLCVTDQSMGHFQCDSKEFPIGTICRDTAVPVGFKWLADADADAAEEVSKEVGMLRYAQLNARATMSINLSVSIREAAHRLNGRRVEHLSEIVHRKILAGSQWGAELY